MVGGSSGQLWLELVSYEGSQSPFKTATSPCLHLHGCPPDFFSAKLKTEWPAEKGLEEHRTETEAKAFHSRLLVTKVLSSSEVLCQRKGEMVPTGEEAFTTWLDPVLPQHCDRNHWDRLSGGAQNSLKS